VTGAQGYKTNTMLFGKVFGEGLTSPWLDCDPRNQDADDADALMLPDSFDMLLSNLPIAYQRPHLKARHLVDAIVHGFLASRW
jgi:hypothetical protein